MNRIYRSIWNHSTGTFVAVSENARAGGSNMSSGVVAGTLGFALKGLAVSLALAFGSHAYANPTGGTVAAGAASISGGAGSMTINQSTQNAAINWQGFSIGAGEAVRFVQPNASAAVLNRVLGADPSNIMGSLSANGKVFLVNPNGILFGKSGSVNVGGLVASTRGISDGDFMAGRYTFAGSGNGTVVNQGTINADGGYVALLGASVSNEGVISARLGSVALAAGNAMTLDVAGDGLLNVAVNQGAVNALVQNKGLIQADGGQVLLTARSAGALLDNVINVDGVIRANSLTNKNGVIRLEGGQAGVVSVSGTLDASGAGAGQTGGSVSVTGQYVGLFGAHIDASGDAGGGTVLVGGDFQGKNPAVQNAAATYMSADSSISADAITSGNGGKVVLWSNDSTRAYGSINARGGAQGGDGGMIETSGHWLDVAGLKPSAGAAHGQNGTWLLDPADVTISGTATTNATNTGGVFSPDSGANASNIAVSDITSILSGVGPLGTNVTINTTNTGASGSGFGDITVSAAITWNGAASAAGSTTLTLNAARDVNINATITATSGNLVVCCGRDITVAAIGPALSRITTTNGSVLLSAGRDIFINGATTTTDGNFAMCAGGDVNVNAAMTLTRGSTIAVESLASLGVRQGMTLSAGNAASGPGLAGGGGAVNIAPPGGTITVTQGGGPTTAAPVTIIYNPLSYATPATDFSGKFTAGTPITVQRLVFPTGPDKTFDGTTTTTLNALSGTPAGVTLVPGATPVANFDTAAVGVGKLITFSGYGLDAVGALSFALPLPCCAPVIQRTTGNIIAAPVVVVVPPPAVVPDVVPVVVPGVVPVVVPGVVPVVVPGVVPVVVPGVVPVVVPDVVPVAPPVVVVPPGVVPPIVVPPGVAPPVALVEVPTHLVPAFAVPEETQPTPGLGLTVIGTGVRMPPPVTLARVVPPPPVVVPPVVVPPIVVPPVYVPPVFPPRKDRN